MRDADSSEQIYQNHQQGRHLACPNRRFAWPKWQLSLFPDIERFTGLIGPENVATSVTKP